MIYYNEIDKDACLQLGELMRRGLIAPGDIDDRSIELVQPGDLAGYVQCHFFAGIGVWSHAARLAGWRDDRPLWTGSCPCQPFSVAGKRRGSADRRHLWPHLFRLIRACRPAAIMGEQVAQKAGWNWFNGVRADLAGAAYQCRGIGLCSCAVDGPDERERIYWGAVAECGDEDRGRRQLQRPGQGQGQGQNGERTSGQFARRDGGECGSLVDDTRLGRGEGRSEQPRWNGHASLTKSDASSGRSTMGDRDGTGHSVRESFTGDAREECQAAGRADDAAERCGTLADSNSDRSSSFRCDPSEIGGVSEAERQSRHNAPLSRGSNGTPIDSLAPARNGSWYADHEWIECHDGKRRRAKPGTSMLVAGFRGRIPLWRGLGGSINAQLAKEAITAFREMMDEECVA